MRYKRDAGAGACIAFEFYTLQKTFKMNRILESSKYLVLMGVIGLLVASAATFVWGAFRTFNFITVLVATRGGDSGVVGSLIEVVDIFLVGTVLLITSLGLYELFISKLDLPDWLVIDDLTKLKTKLTDVIVLILAINFLKFFLKATNMVDLLLQAVAVAVVMGVLVAFGNLRTKEK